MSKSLSLSVSVSLSLSPVVTIRSFKTVVLDRSDSESKLIWETDDFVFVSDCSAYQKHPCTHSLTGQAGGTGVSDETADRETSGQGEVC